MRVAITILAIFGAVGAAAAETDMSTVTIAKSDCILLVEHVPSADVAYQPGVDVRGRKVAPADVEASPDLRDIVPDVLEFSIALNPLKGGVARFGETALEVGKVRFDMKTRRATFNGKPLTRADTRKVRKKCKEILRKAK